MKNPTRHKLQEAEHFLSLMKQTFDDDNLFSFNLSTFLSAARSITFYMQKQYKRRDGFAEWYCPYQIKMSADPELKYLSKARIEDVHIEPVSIETEATSSIAGIINLIKEGCDESKSEYSTEVKLKPLAQNTPTIVRRCFKYFGGVDVKEFCEKQLEKLAKFVEECENNFQ